MSNWILPAALHYLLVLSSPRVKVYPFSFEFSQLLPDISSLFNFLFLDSIETLTVISKPEMIIIMWIHFYSCEWLISCKKHWSHHRALPSFHFYNLSLQSVRIWLLLISNKQFPFADEKLGSMSILSNRAIFRWTYLDTRISFPEVILWMRNVHSVALSCASCLCGLIVQHFAFPLDLPNLIPTCLFLHFSWYWQSW